MPRPRLPLVLLALLASLFAALALPGPARAVAPSVKLVDIRFAVCDQGGLGLVLDLQGVANTVTTFHLELSAAGTIYSQQAVQVDTDGQRSWRPYETFIDVPEAERGDWPLPEREHIRIDFWLTDTSGTVLDTWTSLIDSCASGVMLFNGPGESDVDRDLITTFYDLCPTVAEPARADGCPVIGRTVTFKKDGADLVGRLSATDAALHQLREVVLYRVARGDDKVLATTTTDSRGRFAFAARRVTGDVYAVSPTVVEPTVGRAKATASKTLHLG